MAKRKKKQPKAGNDILLGFVTNGVKAGGDIVDVQTGRRLGGVVRFELTSDINGADMIQLTVYRYGKKSGKVLAHN